MYQMITAIFNEASKVKPRMEADIHSQLFNNNVTVRLNLTIRTTPIVMADKLAIVRNAQFSAIYTVHRKCINRSSKSQLHSWTMRNKCGM